VAIDGSRIEVLLAGWRMPRLSGRAGDWLVDYGDGVSDRVAADLRHDLRNRRLRPMALHQASAAAADRRADRIAAGASGTTAAPALLPLIEAMGLIDDSMSSRSTFGHRYRAASGRFIS